MSKKINFRRIIIFVIAFLIFFITSLLIITPHGDSTINIVMQYSKESNVQLFFKTKEKDSYIEEKSIIKSLDKNIKTIRLNYNNNNYYSRIDFGSETDNEVSIYSMKMTCGYYKAATSIDYIYELLQHGDIIVNEIDNVTLNDNCITFTTTGNDAYMLLSNDLFQWHKQYLDVKYLIISAMIATIIAGFMSRYIHFNCLKEILSGVLNNKHLLFELSKNDFTARYAGSYFGIIWAYAQPISTIIVFWFVFQVAFKNPPMTNVPYFLWMASGLVPWFFFSDGWSMATNTFIEYSYLVKKVVFKIELLPLIKVLSTWFVHLFFVLFVIVLFIINGVFPGIHVIWLIYYMFAMAVLITGLSFATSTFMVFFRDLQPLMGILLQFLMWLTPIMWSTNSFDYNIINIFKVNPMFYIVNGYRYALIGDELYRPTFQYTIYFWVVTVFILIMGVNIFNRIKVHFADVL